MSADIRTEYIAGLRALADLLEQHEDLPLPYYGRHSLTPQMVFVQQPLGGTREALTRYVTALSEVAEAVTTEEAFGYEASGRLGGMCVRVLGPVDLACDPVAEGVWLTPLGAQMVAEPADADPPAGGA